MKILIAAILLFSVVSCVTDAPSAPPSAPSSAMETKERTDKAKLDFTRVVLRFFTDHPACYDQCGDMYCWVCGAAGRGGATEAGYPDGEPPEWWPSQAYPGSEAYCDSEISRRWSLGEICYQTFFSGEDDYQCETSYCSDGSQSQTGGEFEFGFNIYGCADGWSCISQYTNYYSPSSSGPCLRTGCFAPPPPPPPPGGGGPVMPPGDGGPCHGSSCPVEQSNPVQNL